MRVRSFMRAARVEQGLSIGDVVAITGLARGELSMIERGHQLPRDDQVPVMVSVYGDPGGWYPAGVARALATDSRRCPCGEELPMDARRNRVYCSDDCRRIGRTTDQEAER